MTECEDWKLQDEIVVARHELNGQEKQYAQLKKTMEEDLKLLKEQIHKKKAYLGTLESKITNSIRHETKLGVDMVNQLEKVSLPVFSGEKAEYPGWQAAFDECIDAAPATPQYKLLQMKKYLGGEPLQFVKKIGHSAAAYTIAKDKLEKKFGGKRRQMAIYLDELDRFIHFKATQRC